MRVSWRSRRRGSRSLGPGLAVAALVLAGACSRPETPPPTVSVGDPAAGRDAIGRYGCGSCHVIPGIRGADSLVGPPLTSFSRRSFIAGTLPNTEDNLTRWIQDPDSVRPGTAMPDLGVSELEAGDITAYLHTLR